MSFNFTITGGLVFCIENIENIVIFFVNRFLIKLYNITYALDYDYNLILVD